MQVRRAISVRSDRSKWGAKLFTFGYFLLLALVGLQLSFPGFAAGLSETLAQQLRKGEAVWLEVAGARVLAIHGAAEKGPVLGAAILLHDEGAHADWPQVIRPLRGALPAHGWQTLALELPPFVSGGDVAAKTAFAHIDAGFSWLRKKGGENVVLIGHGRGAALAADYLLSKKPKGISGLVLLSPLFEGSSAEQRRKLAKLSVPVLEVIASRDYPLVRRFAQTPRPLPEGKTAIPYRQIEIEGASHDYRSHEAALLKHLRGWLKRFATGKEPSSGA